MKNMLGDMSFIKIPTKGLICPGTDLNISNHFVALLNIDGDCI